MGSDLTVKPGTWAKGQSGNPNGRPKGSKNELTELKQELEIAVRRSLPPEQLIRIVAKMATMAEEGNVKAAKLILDKFVSNATGAEEVSGDTGGIVIRIENATFANKSNHPENVIDATIVEENDEHRSEAEQPSSNSGH